MTKTAVVLLNLGGPSSLQEVKPFLLRLFSDPAILTLPNPFRAFLAFLITNRRLREAKHIYSLLGGGSPLLKNTIAQADALEATLGEGFRTFIAMRYAAPLTAETVEEVRAYEPDRVILLPLYPQYSTTTTASSVKEWQHFTQHDGFKTDVIRSYPTAKGFIDALYAHFKPLYEKVCAQGIPRVLMTAHGLPERIIRRGDPYQAEVEASYHMFLTTAGLSSQEAILCYQSRVGPLKWIGPSTESEVLRASQEKKSLIIVPLSFVSEHSETLVELDITYRDLALKAGCPSYHRVATVNTHPFFIEDLARLVKNKCQLMESRK